MERILAAPVGAEDRAGLVALGLTAAGLDNGALIAAALFEKAKRGDGPAIRELRQLIGEDGSAGAGDALSLMQAILDVKQRD